MDKFDEKARELNRHDHFYVERGEMVQLEPCERCKAFAQFVRDVDATAREEDAETVLASGLLDTKSAFLLADLIRASVTPPGVASSQPKADGSGQSNVTKQTVRRAVVDQLIAARREERVGSVRAAIEGEAK